MNTDIRSKLRQMDVCFVMDTTGSMAAYIKTTRIHIQKFSLALSKAAVKPQINFGVVAYRDHPPQDKTYLTRVFQFSENISETQCALNLLTTGGGGGDGPEAVLDGIYDAITKLDWRKQAQKVIILIGDAPPHGVGVPRDAFPNGCPAGHTIKSITQQAVSAGIVIYSVGVINSEITRHAFSNIANPTGGEFVLLNNVNSLIDRILHKMDVELGKMADDIHIYDYLMRGSTLDEIAKLTGKTVQEIELIISRLHTKDALPVNLISEGIFPANWKNFGYAQHLSNEFLQANSQLSSNDDIHIRIYLKIHIYLRCPKPSSVLVEMPDDVPAEKLVLALVKNLGLPATERYILHYNSAPISDGMSLANVQVKNGDVLQLELKS